MKLHLAEDVVSLTDFSRNTREHAEELIRGGRPRVLTMNGRASMVVLSVEAFENLAHDAEEYRMDLRLRAALEEYDAGNHGTPAEVVFKRISERAKARQAAKRQA
jgi:PHD/YefM family antitoxin component YafN of YafNO toxin-antitoxin module